MGIPVNKDTIAIVHTHPQGGYPEPGTSDYNSRFPNYVFSGDRLYVTIPGTRKYATYNIQQWNLHKLLGGMMDQLVKARK